MKSVFKIFLLFALCSSLFASVATAQTTSTGSQRIDDFLMETDRTVTADDPLEILQTWNEGSTTFTGVKIDITDTASASDSVAFAVDVDGSSVFEVGKDGGVNFGSFRFDGGAVPVVKLGNNLTFQNTGGNSNYLFLNLSNYLQLPVGNGFAWSANTSAASTHDFGIFGDTGVAAIRGGTDAMELQIYNTYTNPSDGEWLELGFQGITNTAVIKTNANGTGTVRNLRIEVGGILNAIFESSNRTKFYNNLVSGSGTETLGESGLRWTGVYAEMISGAEQSSDPSDPDNGSYVLWQSDGTESGDDGDIMLKITDSGGTTKTITLVDYSAF